MDYKVIHHDDQVYHMQHPDGSMFQIAKSSLSPESHRKIKKYCMGGEVKGYDEGGDVKPIESALSHLGLNDPQPIVDTSNQPPPQNEYSAGKSESPPQEVGGQEVPPSAIVPVEPQKPPTLESSLHEQEAALTNQANAVQQKGIEESKGQESIAKLEDKAAEDSASLQKKSDTVRKLNEDEYHRIFDFASNPDNAVKSRKLFEGKDTGQVIGGAIALALGGLAGGLTGHGGNVVMDMMNKTIDREMEAQKENLSNNRNLLSYNLSKTKNDQQADINTRLNLLAITEAKLHAATARAQSPIAKEQAAILQSGIDREKAQLHAASAAMTATTVAKSSFLDPKTIPNLPKEDQKGAVILPNGKAVIALPGREKEGQAVVTDYQPAFEMIDKLKKLKTSPLEIGSKDYEEAQQIGANLATQILQIKGIKRLSPEVLKMVGKLKTDPTSIRGFLSGGTRTNELERQLYNDYVGKMSSYFPAFKNPKGAGGFQRKE